MKSKICCKCHGRMFLHKDPCFETKEAYVHFWRCINCSNTEWVKAAQYKALYLGEVESCVK